MLRRVLLTAMLGGLATAAAAATPPSVLPDFPTAAARPGECWARTPVHPGPVHPDSAPGGQAVWTLEQGAGPGAVWRFSERRGAPAGAHPPVLGWAPVDCGSGRAQAKALVPHPPAMLLPPPPLAHGPAPFGAEPAPPYADEGPYAEPHNGPPAHGHAGPPAHAFKPPHGHGHGHFGVPGQGHHPHAHAGPPAHGFLHPPHVHAGPPPRPFPAPQFGARFLHWPGKTLR